MKKGFWILKMAVFGVVAIGLFGWATQLLWNSLIPALFAGPVITIWQAFGLLLLSKILFWSGGKCNHHGGHWKHEYWKRHWGGMSPEEKDAFKKKMKEKWCQPRDTSAGGETPSANV